MNDDDLFFSYLSCKHKGYLTLKGEKGELPEYGLLQTKLRQDYKNAATSTIICSNRQSFAPRTSPLTIADLKRGAPFIVDADIEHRSLMCRLDALRRVDGKSPLGPFYYVPVVFSENDIGGKQLEQLLALQGLILSHVQKIHPNIGMVVCGPGHKFKTLNLEKYRSETQQIVDEVVDVFNNITVPKLILNKHCRVCRYEKRCLDQAKKEDNLGLIGMGEKDIRKFNRKGIFTVNQLSYTFRPRRRNKRLKAHPLLHNHALQALAIREKKVYIFQRCSGRGEWQANTIRFLGGYSRRRERDIHGVFGTSFGS